ncbi:rCG41278, partial [Rattus norvegicus]
MKESIVEKSPMHVSSVGKPSCITMLFDTMNRFTGERRPMAVSNYVGKPSHFIVPSIAMKGLTLGRNPMYVNSVGKPLCITVLFVAMKIFTLQRNPMCVSCVGQPSLITVLFNAMKE